jgi:hypothetical protein
MPMQDIEIDARIVIMVREIEAVRKEMAALREQVQTAEKWRQQTLDLLDKMDDLMKVDDTIRQLVDMHSSLSARILKLEYKSEGLELPLQS